METTLETLWQGQWGRQWTPHVWGVETAVETSPLRTLDLPVGEWRRHWRPKEWSPHEKLGNGPTPLSLGNRDDSGFQATLETLRLRIRDNREDLAAGEWRGHWRLSGLGSEATVDT